LGSRCARGSHSFAAPPSGVKAAPTYTIEVQWVKGDQLETHLKLQPSL